VPAARHLIGGLTTPVSPVGLGTAALGMAYGLPQATAGTAPSRTQAVNVIHRALRAGINFFDTAPAYGNAEEVVGEALAGVSDVVIGTKVQVAWHRSTASAADVLGEMRRSVEGSLRYLRRSRLDILQVHSATAFDIQDERIHQAFEDLRREGTIAVSGYTVYGEEAGFGALKEPSAGIVQIGFSIVDQRARQRVFGESLARGVAIVTRSALLKGALSPGWRGLPDELGPLKKTIARISRNFRIADSDLPLLATRYCLSHVPPVVSVLVGAANEREIDTALAAMQAGGLPHEVLAALEKFAIHDETMINPALWP
jgi:aryl-alcohol dehydrogenase-like predicted oxidoreductase